MSLMSPSSEVPAETGRRRTSAAERDFLSAPQERICFCLFCHFATGPSYLLQNFLILFRLSFCSAANSRYLINPRAVSEKTWNPKAQQALRAAALFNALRSCCPSACASLRTRLYRSRPWRNAHQEYLARSGCACSRWPTARSTRRWRRCPQAQA